jgi:predicted CopG family antitoxin
MYSQEEQLEIYKRIGVTKEVYDLLRKEKRRSKQSMAKLICNLTIKHYGAIQTPPN